MVDAGSTARAGEPAAAGTAQVGVEIAAAAAGSE
jgi:hypothetical protein